MSRTASFMDLGGSGATLGVIEGLSTDTGENSDATEIVLRQLSLDDFEPVMAMLAELVIDYPDQFAENWSNSRDQRKLVEYGLEKGWGLIALHNDVAVGHIGWRTGRSAPPQSVVEHRVIESLYVVPEYRQRKVAQMLARRCVADCIANNIHVLRINALPDPAAIALFESLGFVEQRRVMELLLQGDKSA